MDTQKEMDQLIDEFIEDESGIVSDSQDADYVPNSSNKKRKRIQNRAKVTHSWTEEDILKLISEVEIRPCLWNVAQKEYKNRFKRDAAWQEIMVEIGDKKFPTEELCSKWQNLRTQFRNSIANAKKTKSGQAASSKPHWKYHSQMEFVSAAEESQTVHSISNLFTEDTEDSMTVASGSSGLSSFGSSGVAVRHSKAKRTPTVVNVEEEFANKERDEALISGMKCAMERLQQKKPSDDVQTFGNFLVAELRKIRSPTYREATQRQLLQLLWDRIDQEPVINWFRLEENSFLFSI